MNMHGQFFCLGRQYSQKHMSPAPNEVEHNPYAPYRSEEEWWKAEEERIREGIAQASSQLFELRNGGTARILLDIMKKKIERGDESAVDYFDLFSGSLRVTPRNPHPLTQEQLDDLEKNIIKEFGHPKFS
jgi:hypothetical protein